MHLSTFGRQGEPVLLPRAGTKSMHKDTRVHSLITLNPHTRSLKHTFAR